MKLIHHATISICPKVLESFKTNLKSSLNSGPHHNCEILNESLGVCFAVTIHYTTISNIFKTFPKTKSPIV